MIAKFVWSQHVFLILEDIFIKMNVFRQLEIYYSQAGIGFS